MLVQVGIASWSICRVCDEAVCCGDQWNSLTHTLSRYRVSQGQTETNPRIATTTFTVCHGHGIGIAHGSVSVHRTTLTDP